LTVVNSRVLESLVSLIPNRMFLCVIVLDLVPLVLDALIQLMTMIAVVLPVAVVIVLVEMLTVIEARPIVVTMMMTAVAMAVLLHVLVVLLMIIHHLVVVVSMILIVETTRLRIPMPMAMEADPMSDHPQEIIHQEKPATLMTTAEEAVIEFSRCMVDRIRTHFLLMTLRW
jgi:hypothetical protein